MTNGRVQGFSNICGKTRLEYICISEICFPAYWADSFHFGENLKKWQRFYVVRFWNGFKCPDRNSKTNIQFQQRNNSMAIKLLSLINDSFSVYVCTCIRWHRKTFSVSQQCNRHCLGGMAKTCSHLFHCAFKQYNLCFTVAVTKAVSFENINHGAVRETMCTGFRENGWRPVMCGKGAI